MGPESPCLSTRAHERMVHSGQVWYAHHIRRMRLRVPARTTLVDAGFQEKTLLLDQVAYLFSFLTQFLLQIVQAEDQRPRVLQVSPVNDKPSFPKFFPLSFQHFHSTLLSSSLLVCILSIIHAHLPNLRKSPCPAIAPSLVSCPLTPLAQLRVETNYTTEPLFNVWLRQARTGHQILECCSLPSHPYVPSFALLLPPAPARAPTFPNKLPSSRYKGR
jgi:hypothetical protein